MRLATDKRLLPMNRYPSIGQATQITMPSRGYLLCTIERTGTNLLTDALAGTGIAGRPLEYFNPVEQEKPWMRDILGDSTLVDGLPKILMAGTTPNGLFGAKVHWGHWRYFGMSIEGEWNDSQRAAPYELLRSRLPNLLSQAAACELLRSRFSDLHSQANAYALLRSRLFDLRVIWLRRQNMVSRAISLFRARQTGIWYQPVSKGRTVPGEQAPEFDLGEIHNLYCLGRFQEESWQRFFQEHEISPHYVVYEELVADYESTVRRVLGFLGLEGEQTLIPLPRSLKQSDALSEEWEERYRKLRAEAEKQICEGTL
jgi:LPS sulfotransferase NodH